MTDDYDDLMRERDRFEEQNGELNVENQELRMRVEERTAEIIELQDQLHKMTQQRDGWSIIARQFARLRSAHRMVVNMMGDHLVKQTQENIQLGAVVEALIDDNLTDL